MNDVINQITESHGRSNMFACTMLKALIQSKRRGCNVLSSYSHLNPVFLFIVFLNMPLLLRASPSSNPIENARLRSSSNAVSSVQCQRSLLGKKQDDQSFYNLGSSSSAPVIDELVELNLSGRGQVPGDSLWRQINVQSLIAEKRAEIERTLGKDRAIDLFREVQGQVLKRIMEPDDPINRDDGRANSANLPRQNKLTVFKPTLNRAFDSHSGRIFSAEFSPDGRQVLTASPLDQTAKLWDARSGQLLHTFDGHNDQVRSAEFSPGGRQVLTASNDHTAKLWDATTGQLIHTFDGHSEGVRSAEFSPDGRQVLTASDDKTAKLWDATSGQLLQTFEGHSGGVRSAEFSPDGKQVLTASEDRTVKLWDASSGQLLYTLEGHNASVNSAVFSPDGRQVLSGSDDMTAKLWSLYSEVDLDNEGQADLPGAVGDQR